MRAAGRGRPLLPHHTQRPGWRRGRGAGALGQQGQSWDHEAAGPWGSGAMGWQDWGQGRGAVEQRGCGTAGQWGSRAGAMRQQDYGAAGPWGSGARALEPSETPKQEAWEG